MLWKQGGRSHAFKQLARAVRPQAQLVHVNGYELVRKLRVRALSDPKVQQCSEPVAKE